MDTMSFRNSGHQITSRKQTIIPQKSTLIKTKKDRPFICSICTRGFTRLEHLKRHEQSHTNEKPFLCTLCGKCFARKDLILRHQQNLHANEYNTQMDGAAQGRGKSDSYVIHLKGNKMSVLPIGPSSACALKQDDSFDNQGFKNEDTSFKSKCDKSTTIAAKVETPNMDILKEFHESHEEAKHEKSSLFNRYELQMPLPAEMNQEIFSIENSFGIMSDNVQFAEGLNYNKYSENTHVFFEDYPEISNILAYDHTLPQVTGPDNKSTWDEVLESQYETLITGRDATIKNDMPHGN